MIEAVADTSVFIAIEAGRPLGPLPEAISVSVITAAELELGVLRAASAAVRAKRLATLSFVRSTFPLLAIDDSVASHFASIADEELRAGRRLRRHDVWIAASARRHGAAVLTQDRDFTKFASVEVIRV